jgi:prepilin-type N-terminal cleavage/methylation domain-containing protein
MKKKAFTLVELLVVVAIIGILSSLGVVGYNSYTAIAKERVCIANF